MWNYVQSNELYHYGIRGQRWGIRRFQNPDGSLTPAGRKRVARNDYELERMSIDQKYRSKLNRLKTQGKRGSDLSVVKTRGEYEIALNEAKIRYNNALKAEKMAMDDESAKQAKAQKANAVKDYVSALLIVGGIMGAASMVNNQSSNSKNTANNKKKNDSGKKKDSKQDKSNDKNSDKQDKSSDSGKSFVDKLRDNISKGPVKDLNTRRDKPDDKPSDNQDKSSDRGKSFINKLRDNISKGPIKKPNNTKASDSKKIEEVEGVVLPRTETSLQLYKTSSNNRISSEPIYVDYEDRTPTKKSISITSVGKSFVDNLLSGSKTSMSSLLLPPKSDNNKQTK